MVKLEKNELLENVSTLMKCIAELPSRTQTEPVFANLRPTTTFTPSKWIPLSAPTSEMPLSKALLLAAAYSASVLKYCIMSQNVY